MTTGWRHAEYSSLKLDAVARQTGGPGSCLISILVLLVFMAAFGLVSWDTVGGFAQFIVLLFVSLAILVGGSVLFAYMSADSS
jgi:hypothetical protein